MLPDNQQRLAGIVPRTVKDLLVRIGTGGERRIQFSKLGERNTKPEKTIAWGPLYLPQILHIRAGQVGPFHRAGRGPRRYVLCKSFRYSTVGTYPRGLAFSSPLDDPWHLRTVPPSHPFHLELLVMIRSPSRRPFYFCHEETQHPVSHPSICPLPERWKRPTSETRWFCTIGSLLGTAASQLCVFLLSRPSSPTSNPTISRCSTMLWYGFISNGSTASLPLMILKASPPSHLVSKGECNPDHKRPS